MTVRQGPNFDRWLMRIKDLIQIVLALSSAIYVAYKFVNKIDGMDTRILQLQSEVSTLRVEVTNERRN